VLDFFAGSSTTAHAVMSLNYEDGELYMTQWDATQILIRKAGFYN
jgi:hypothetical protein